MTFYTRGDWAASPPRSTPTPFGPNLPNSVTVHAVGAPLAEKPEYLATVKAIQNHAFQKGLSDIDYNFLVDLHGNIYEGRGGEVRSGAQHVGNSTSLSVCYLDNGDENIPFTDEAKKAILVLRHGWTANGDASAIHPHRWWNNGGQYDTNCPGDEIAAWCANPVVEENDLTPEEHLRLLNVENQVKEINQLIHDLATGWAAFRNGWQNDGSATDEQMTKGVQKLRANAYTAATRPLA